MFGLLRRLKRHPDAIPDALWQPVRDAVPWVATLDGERDARLRGLSARFLHEKTITPVADLVLDAPQRCMRSTPSAPPVQ